MKKGQAYLILILILAVIVLTVIGVYRASDKEITGEVVSEDAVEATELTEEINNACELEVPFECSVWKVDFSKQEISFRIENIGFDDYIIRDFAVEGCSSPSSFIEIPEKGARIFSVGCPFAEADIFDSLLKVYYKKSQGGPTETSEGRLVYQI